MQCLNIAKQAICPFMRPKQSAHIPHPLLKLLSSRAPTVVESSIEQLSAPIRAACMKVVGRQSLFEGLDEVAEAEASWNLSSQACFDDS